MAPLKGRSTGYPCILYIKIDKVVRSFFPSLKCSITSSAVYQYLGSTNTLRFILQSLFDHDPENRFIYPVSQSSTTVHLLIHRLHIILHLLIEKHNGDVFTSPSYANILMKNVKICFQPLLDIFTYIYFDTLQSYHI